MEVSELTRLPTMVKSVCWECGEDKDCIEYTVCCTGTLFHICPDCEKKVQARDEMACATKEPVTAEQQ